LQWTIKIFYELKQDFIQYQPHVEADVLTVTHTDLMFEIQGKHSTNFSSWMTLRVCKFLEGHSTGSYPSASCLKNYSKYCLQMLPKVIHLFCISERPVQLCNNTACANNAFMPMTMGIYHILHKCLPID
jgi:hypothetical protein